MKLPLLCSSWFMFLLCWLFLFCMHEEPAAFSSLLGKGNSSWPREQHSSLEKHLHGNAPLGTLLSLWPAVEIFPRPFPSKREQCLWFVHYTHSKESTALISPQIASDVSRDRWRTDIDPTDVRYYWVALFRRGGQLTSAVAVSKYIWKVKDKMPGSPST